MASVKRSIVVYLDTCCVGAKGKIKSLNLLWDYHSKGLINIEKTDTLDLELLEGEGYQLGFKKVEDLIENYGVAVVDHSRLGHCVLADSSEVEDLKTIHKILWGRDDVRHLNKNQVRDSLHVHTAVKYGACYFVTTDKKILAKSDEIQRKFKRLKICSPRVCVGSIRDFFKHKESG